jgi:hypothetical protein
MRAWVTLKTVTPSLEAMMPLETDRNATRKKLKRVDRVRKAGGVRGSCFPCVILDGSDVIGAGLRQELRVRTLTLSALYKIQPERLSSMRVS